MKFLSSLLILFTTSLVNFLVPEALKTAPDMIDTPTQIQNSTGTLVSYDNQDYLVHWFKVNDLDKVKLLANFESQSKSAQVADELGCEYLVNGGFYSESNEPIGWFKTDNQTASLPENNKLFNGYLSIIHDKLARIENTNQSIDFAHSGIQTGPLLIESGKVTRLQLNQDKHARRSFAAITQDQSLIFGMVVNKQSQLDGPQLSDLGYLLEELSQIEDLAIVDAINLDGGSASTFISPDLAITELNPVGSFFCIQP